jgi:hypothetical protein
MKKGRSSIWITAAFVGVALGLSPEPAHAQTECVTGFDPPELNIPWTGGPFTFRVLAPADCTWRYEFFPALFGLPVPLIGATGPATVTSQAIPNIQLEPRIIVARIGSTSQGRSYTITQAGAPCVVSLSRSASSPLPANGGSGSFTVNGAGPDCSFYRVESESSGLTIQSAANGTSFPATINFTVAPTSSQFIRTLRVNAFPTETFPFASASLDITQNGPPITTNLVSSSLSFALHRYASGNPYVTPPAPLVIANTESPGAAWAATTTAPWLMVTPSSGAGPAGIKLSVDPSVVTGNSGNLTAVLNITSPVAPNSPRGVTVFLSITNSIMSTRSPFGTVDIPRPLAVLSGAVAMGGWATDDVGIGRVQIYRSAVPPELPLGLVYLGDATRVWGARPDVAIRGGPDAMSAGWGFMILTNTLPNHGNGPFTLYAFADDVEGHRSLLGQTTVTFDNTSSVKPIGTIDTPRQGGAFSGTDAVHGWVVAQPGREIPIDGSTIRLFIDGAQTPLVASYNHNRPDVQAVFPPPTYTNSAGAGGFFMLDSTTLTDGLHTMVWVVTDNLGAIEGIGSRYFTVDNAGGSIVSASAAPAARSTADPFWASPLAMDRARNEIRHTRAERLEVTLDSWHWLFGCGRYSAYLVSGETAGPLPPGASFDAERGVFTWLSPTEFAGTFDFVFVRTGCGKEAHVPLRVVIAPEVQDIR